MYPVYRVNFYLNGNDSSNLINYKKLYKSSSLY